MDINNKPITSFRGEYSFLSNFYNAPFMLDGHSWPTVEHGYQAFKTLLPSRREKIRQAKNPSIAKRMGRESSQRPDWGSIKIQTMRLLVLLKFCSNKELMDKLLNTGNLEIVEKNYWGDKFWGTCEGEGENWLGKILMEVREKLRLITKEMTR